MPKAPQEWQCSPEGGGCGIYISIKLNMAIEGVVELKCPMCNHLHQRTIDRGIVKERDRFNGRPTQVITVTKAACHKEPITERMKKLKKEGRSTRDGIEIPEMKNPSKKTVAKRMLGSLWHRNNDELKAETKGS